MHIDTNICRYTQQSLQNLFPAVWQIAIFCRTTPNFVGQFYILGMSTNVEIGIRIFAYDHSNIFE